MTRGEFKGLTGHRKIFFGRRGAVSSPCLFVLTLAGKYRPYYRSPRGDAGGETPPLPFLERRDIFCLTYRSDVMFEVRHH